MKIRPLLKQKNLSCYRIIMTTRILNLSVFHRCLGFFVLVKCPEAYFLSYPEEVKYFGIELKKTQRLQNKLLFNVQSLSLMCVLHEKFFPLLRSSIISNFYRNPITELRLLDLLFHDFLKFKSRFSVYFNYIYSRSQS